MFADCGDGDESGFLRWGLWSQEDTYCEKHCWSEAKPRRNHVQFKGDDAHQSQVKQCNVCFISSHIFCICFWLLEVAKVSFINLKYYFSSRNVLGLFIKKSKGLQWGTYNWSEWDQTINVKIDRSFNRKIILSAFVELYDSNFCF